MRESEAFQNKKKKRGLRERLDAWARKKLRVLEYFIMRGGD